MPTKVEKPSRRAVIVGDYSSIDSVPANVKARRFRLQYKCERLYIAFIRLEREKRAANLFG